ncbi:MAG: hypothetical protein ACREMB_00105 [Candidatus Rokuibacteriota bacterium]
MARLAAVLALVGLALAGCATTRVVPVAAPGVAVDPEAGSSATAADGVQLVIRPSAWHGRPSSLPTYVTPFHVRIVNGSPQLIRYDYPDLRLYDDARFQYTALPPAEVARMIQWAEGPRGVVVASASLRTVPRHRRHALFWDPWWGPWGAWGPWGPWGPYWGPPPPPRVDDVFLQALPVADLHAGAQTHGFVYFPRLRREAHRLTFEFHYRLGETPRVLTVPFAVERAERGGGGPTAS